MEPESVNWAHHDTGSTTVATVLVHLEQMSSGWHEHHESVLVHGCLGDLPKFLSTGRMFEPVP